MVHPPLRSPITLITDGACSGNGTADSRGGWAAILVDAAGHEVVLTGGEAPSTNNRMELMAAIEGLAAAPENADIELVTDSTYLANAISQGWLNGWQRRGWRTAAKQPVANRELWERMIVELRRHQRVRTTLVRGHSGHDANERADRLAQQAALEDYAPAGSPQAARSEAPGGTGEHGQLGFTFEA
jgi:ribonuclease HI